MRVRVRHRLGEEVDKLLVVDLDQRDLVRVRVRVRG